MAEANAKTTQQEREEVFAALQCAASCHCLMEEFGGDLRGPEKRGDETLNGVVR